jgi:hypothetical protein
VPEVNSHARTNAVLSARHLALRKIGLNPDQLPQRAGWTVWLLTPKPGHPMCRVNTPSAKADGFFGELGYCQAYTQLACSRPGASKDIQRRVLIPVDYQAAFTSVNANIQALGYGCATGRALLAGTIREHFDYFSPSLRNFVGEYFDEARPCYIGNRSGKPGVLDHALHVQVFHSDPAVAGNQIIGNFVSMLVAQVSDSSVQPGNLASLPGSVTAAKFLPAKRALRPPQPWKLSFKKPGVLNFEAVGSDKEMRESDIKSGSWKNIADFDWFRQFAAYDHEPFIGFALQAKRLDFAIDLTVKTDADYAGMLDAKPIAFESDAVAVARVENRVEPVSAFESRIARDFSGFNPLKEVSKCLVEATQRALSTRKVDSYKVRIDEALILEPARLILIRTRDLPFVVEPLPLRQGVIVESPVRLEHNRELTLLVGVGPETEFVSAKHRSLSFLCCDVSAHRRFADMPNSSSVVTTTPKCRQTRTKRLEFHSQHPTAVAFEPISNLGHGPCGIGRDF